MSDREIRDVIFRAAMKLQRRWSKAKFGSRCDAEVGKLSRSRWQSREALANLEETRCTFPNHPRRAAARSDHRVAASAEAVDLARGGPIRFWVRDGRR